MISCVKRLGRGLVYYMLWVGRRWRADVVVKLWVKM